MKRRTTVMAAAVLGVLASAGAGAGVGPGAGAGSAQAASEPLIRTGDIDLFEDVLEHISVTMGDGGGTVRQLYDSRGAGDAGGAGDTGGTD